MPFTLSRRRLLVLSGLGVLGAGGYGMARALQSVRDAAGRMADT